MKMGSPLYYAVMKMLRGSKYGPNLANADPSWMFVGVLMAFVVIMVGLNFHGFGLAVLVLGSVIVGFSAYISKICFEYWVHQALAFGGLISIVLLIILIGR